MTRARGARALLRRGSRRSSRRITRAPRARSAAATYSSPSGSTRKNGPSPNRSFPVRGRSSRTSIRTILPPIPPDFA